MMKCWGQARIQIVRKLCQLLYSANLQIKENTL